MEGLILNGFSLGKSPYSKCSFFFSFFFDTPLSWRSVQQKKRRCQARAGQSKQYCAQYETLLKHVHYKLLQTTHFFNRLEDQFPAGGKHWSCKENVAITTKSRNSLSLMSFATTQSLFVFFRLPKVLFPGVKENRLNSEVEFAAPRLTSGWTATHYPSPLQMAALCIWKCAQVSYAAGAEGYSRNQPMPA